MTRRPPPSPPQLSAPRSVTVGGIFGQLPVSQGSTVAYVSSAGGNVTLLDGGSISAGGVFVVAAAAVSFGGTALALTTIADPSHCGLAGQGPLVPAVVDVPCVPGEANNAAGFTLWVTAATVLVTKSGIAQGAAVRVCAGRLAVFNGGSISAGGLGCSAERGYGAGDSAAQAASSGAGHGGVGGGGVSPINPAQFTVGGVAYDNVTAPRMLGSGGGDRDLGGSGGGLLWLEVSGELRNDGVIGAPGVAGAVTTTPEASGGGGGGAGGALILIVGNLTGAGAFDLSGGAGGSEVRGERRRGRRCASLPARRVCVQGGGGGSGGVINVAPVRSAGSGTPPGGRRRGLWTASSFAGSLNNEGGLGSAPGFDGGHGVAMSSPPCDAGYGGALCLPCGPGKFKSVAASNEWCRDCPVGTYSNGTANTACTGEQAEGRGRPRRQVLEWHGQHCVHRVRRVLCRA